MSDNPLGVDSQFLIPPTEIIDGLWIGNYYDFEDQEFLDREGIDVIINLTGSIRMFFVKKYHIIIPLDQPFGNTKEDAEIAVTKLAEVHNNGLNILVHCLSGKDRSPTVVAGLLQNYKFNGDH
jgi:protein-tyrosine phosphatase